jgi:hypothetical protein
MQPIIPNPSRGGSFFFSALALLGPPRIYFEYLRTDHVHPICGRDSRRKALTCSVVRCAVDYCQFVCDGNAA